MASVRSQPINTISYTQIQPTLHERIKPKFLHLHDEGKMNATMEYQPKKLPFNLFLSATEYNKMLITNGKNRKKKSGQIVDGLITSLQYMNDPIFQRQTLKRTKARQHLKIELRPDQMQTIKISQIPKKKNFSEFRKQSSKHCKKLSNLPSNKLNKVQSIDYETIDLPINKRYSINHKPKYKKSKFIAQSRRAHTSLDKVRKNSKSYFNDQSIIKKYKTKRNRDISHLVIKSLIEFDQKKKEEQIQKLSRERTKSAKQQYLRNFNQNIRACNLQASRRSAKSKSKSKEKSLSKHQISLNYWDQIKDQVMNSLKNDNYSHPLKTQLQNYSLNVYEHKEIARRKPNLKKQQIQYLRQARGSQARKKLKSKSLEKKCQQNEIKRNLRSLDKQRKRRISLNPKKSFQPTAKMIRSAFQNIAQSNESHFKKQLQDSKSIFTSEGIRKIKNKK